MKNTIEVVGELRKNNTGYWADRVLSQLEYAIKLKKVKPDMPFSLIDEAVEYLFEQVQNQNAITCNMGQHVENMLLPLSKIAKQYKMICAAHAHIDMNWMWGFAETVAITLDTFRTMLDLMDKYPQFKFSQSQASVYRIVEKYNPAMLKEIIQRIREGRWEVVASTWVEADKNLPNGESHARHLLYTKEYLTKLLGIDMNTLNIDFEPDTFGHSVNVPEILAKGGVKYYYHCRGYDGENLYKWQSPSGSSVIVYKDQLWYNAVITSSIAMYVPEFCAKYGINTSLKVYGVGDHGGGPTRKDIEKLQDMSAWPVFPNIILGTFGEFYKEVETIADKLPIVKNELNFIFTGCYTSQSRIKMSNRVSEEQLDETETYSTFSSVFAKGTYNREEIKESWKKVLFSHFHDILTGSGMIETREYALGEFQKVMAVTSSEKSLALRNIASRIDTSCLGINEEDVLLSSSEGAGVGYGISENQISHCERGLGKTRIFHFFNPSVYDRNEVTEVVVWNWDGDKDRIVFKDTKGKPIKHKLIYNEIINNNLSPYWGHNYHKLLIEVKIPAYGYNTYIMSETESVDIPFAVDWDPRTEHEFRYQLENEHIKVVFDHKNMTIISLVDKSSGKELINPEKPGGSFRLIEEDDGVGMTSWKVGRYVNVHSLNKDIKVVDQNINTNDLRQWISFETVFRSSKLKVKISLDHNSTSINYSVDCDWQEVGGKGKFIPQLNFIMPFGFSSENYIYDVPFGTIERCSMDMDVPANSWAVALNKEKENGIMLVTATKYGFRGFDNSIAISLIRSSFDPDPYPENGMHNIKFAVKVIGNSDKCTLIQKAYEYNHPISYLSDNVHTGCLSPEYSFMKLYQGNVAISSIKVPEKGPGNQLLVKMYETEGQDSEVIIKFPHEVSNAYNVDLNEQIIDSKPAIRIDSGSVYFKIEAHSIANILITTGNY